MQRKDLKCLAINISRKYGDAIAGEKIIAQAREIDSAKVFHGTSTHQIQEIALRKNVLCVIDRPFRIRETPMKLR